jgi:hypothetical protein
MDLAAPVAAFAGVGMNVALFIRVPLGVLKVDRTAALRETTAQPVPGPALMLSRRLNREVHT